MDEQQQPSAWDFSRLGNAIDRYVDRQLNNPQIVRDASNQYGVSPDGQLYRLGQAGQPSDPVRVNLNSDFTMLLMLGIAIFLFSKAGD